MQPVRRTNALCYFVRQPYNIWSRQSKALGFGLYLSKYYKCRIQGSRSVPLTYIPVRSLYGSKMADENTVKETCRDVKNTTPSTSIAGLADSVKTPIEDTELDELLDSTCYV